MGILSFFWTLFMLGKFLSNTMIKLLYLSPKSYFKNFHKFLGKVKKNLKIAWIRSHHLQWKFRLWTGTIAWGVKAKHCWALSTHFWKQKFVDITQQCFALLPQVNFPANNLNFHWMWRWWDWTHIVCLNIFYFTYTKWFFSPHNLSSIYINCTYESYFILKCLKFMEDMVSPSETFQSSTIQLISQVWMEFLASYRLLIFRKSL